MVEYRVFKRRPWKRNPITSQWEPHGRARKITVSSHMTLEEASELCALGNKDIDRSKPGQVYYKFERMAKRAKQ